MLGLYGGSVVVCFLAGLIPLINTEAFLVAVSMWGVSSPAQLPLVVVLGAIGQMTAKVLLYYAGLGMFELPRGRWKAKIEKARASLDRWSKRPYLIFALSSSTGLPPFYLVSIAAGAMRIGFRAFCVIGLLGRIVRFAVIVAIPWLV